MAKEELLKDIKDFEYISKDRYEVMEKLLKKDYSDAEIIEEFDKYPFKPKWNYNVLGFFMVSLAIVIGFNIQSTFGSFDYEFDSAGDFFRLNEWVLKPYLILALLFTGINGIIDKGYINQNIRFIMIIIFSIFLITSVVSNSGVSLSFGVIGIIIYSLCKPSTSEDFSDAEMLISAIESGNQDRKSILRKISANEGKKWNGSAVFLFLLLAFCLFLNSPINVTSEIVNQTENSTSYRASVQSIDTILIYGLKALLGLSLVVSVFLNINLKKFRILLFGIMLISGIYVMSTLFHSNFQTSIFPALIIIIAGIAAIDQNKLLPGMRKRETGSED